MSQSPTVPCQQIKHLDNSSPIADLVSFGSVTRRFGQYSEVNSSIHLYVVLGAIHKLCCNLFWSGQNFLLHTKNDLQHFEKKLWINDKFREKNSRFVVQGVKGESGKCLSSKFGWNQCLYWNKWYISRKPLILALIWHPKSGRGIIRRVPHPLAAKSIGARGVKKGIVGREGVAASW